MAVDGSAVGTLRFVFINPSCFLSVLCTHEARGSRPPPMPCGSDCGTARDALNACKRELGLHPRQCYPSSYKGQCDAAEFELKQCLAFAADPRDAKLLYDASRPREVRVAANARLQKKLKDQPCSP
jgi:hypothetical protein